MERWMDEWIRLTGASGSSKLDNSSSLSSNKTWEGCLVVVVVVVVVVVLTELLVAQVGVDEHAKELHSDSNSSGGWGQEESIDSGNIGLIRSSSWQHSRLVKKSLLLFVCCFVLICVILMKYCRRHSIALVVPPAHVQRYRCNRRIRDYTKSSVTYAT